MCKNSNRKFIIASLISLLVIPFTLSLGQARWNLVKEDIVGFNDIFTEEVRSSTPVAYVDTNDADHQYYTIEGALKAAKEDTNSNTIYVIPAEAEGQCNTVSILHDCEIAAGDTLVLPYSGTEYLNETGPHGDGFADNNTNNRKIQVKLIQNVTLTINGGFIIGGVNGSSSNPMGQASGSYCELTMYTGSSIIVNGGAEGNDGKLMCFGYIKEESVEDEDPQTTIEFKSGSTMITPIVFYDYSSGTKVLNMSTNGVFPFKQYDVPSVRSEMVFNYGSTLVGKLHLYGGNVKDINLQASLIAKDGGFLNLTSSGSKISWKFIDQNSKTTSRTMTSHHSNIRIFGDCQLGSIKVSIKLAEVLGKPINKDIDSKDYYLPIPCGFDVSIASKSTFTVPEKIGNDSLKGAKFMPGSNLTVEDGGNVVFNSNILFYQGKTSSDGSSSLDDYDDDNKYPSSSPAAFNNFGVVYVNSGFEGVIQTNSSNAITYFSEKYGTISDSKEGDSESTYSWGGAKGLINHSETISSFQKPSKYCSESNQWISAEKKFSVKINAKSYRSWGIRHYPNFDFFFTNSLENDMPNMTISSLCQKTLTGTLVDNEVLSLSGFVFKGDYIKIKSIDECDEISDGFAFNQWIEVTQDLNITITAKP